MLVPVLGPPAELLFLVRPETLSSHSGQVAFPGGRIDPDDRDAIHAALREAEEELGIPTELPEVIGALDDVNTHTGFHVRPFVALLPADVPLRPSAQEVASVFRVPLGRLTDPTSRRSLRGSRRPVGGRAGDELRLHFWIDTPEPIWGVTGQILSNLLKILG